MRIGSERTEAKQSRGSISPSAGAKRGVGEVSEPTGYEINGIGEGSGRNSGETSPRGQSIAEPA